MCHEEGVSCLEVHVWRKMWNLDMTNGEMHVKRGTIEKSKENCLGHNRKFLEWMEVNNDILYVPDLHK